MIVEIEFRRIALGVVDTVEHVRSPNRAVERDPVAADVLCDLHDAGAEPVAGVLDAGIEKNKLAVLVGIDYHLLIPVLQQEVGQKLHLGEGRYRPDLFSAQELPAGPRIEEDLDAWPRVVQPADDVLERVRIRLVEPVERDDVGIDGDVMRHDPVEDPIVGE